MITRQSLSSFVSAAVLTQSFVFHRQGFFITAPREDYVDYNGQND